MLSLAELFVAAFFEALVQILAALLTGALAPLGLVA